MNRKKKSKFFSLLQLSQGMKLNCHIFVLWELKDITSNQNNISSKSAISLEFGCCPELNDTNV